LTPPKGWWEKMNQLVIRELADRCQDQFMLWIKRRVQTEEIPD
jgi:hypothetical protein